MMTIVEQKQQILADYIGLVKSDIGWLDINNIFPSYFGTHEELLFYESWEWLIPTLQYFLKKENIEMKVCWQALTKEAIINYIISNIKYVKN